VWRLTGPIVGCALLVGVAAGCTAARSGLGTSDSSCYQALPTASAAVGSQAKLLGVHLYTVGALRRLAPHLVSDLKTTEPSGQQVCVVAFKGSFDQSRVKDGQGRASGKLAVVVATSPSNHLLGTVIFTRVPLNFGHFHFG
jgi:hypothetical protein